MKVTFELFDYHADAIVMEKATQGSSWSDFMNELIMKWPKYKRVLDKYDEHVEEMRKLRKEMNERRKQKNV